ncbi:MAG: winged helix-turn-helix domain-containing protein [Pseudomonadota bacterium]
MDSIPIGSRFLQPNRQLLVNGERISIGPRALSIISVLAQADGEVVTKDELLETVWPGITVEENALQVHIAAIRKALGQDADRLHTLRGVGYQLEIGQPDLPSPDLPSETQSLSFPSATVLTPESGGPAETVKDGRKPALRRVWMAIALLVIATVLLGWMLQRDPGSASSDLRVAVLVRPFSADNQGSASADAMASGITDELIVRLRHESQLLVGTDDPSQQITEGPFADAYLVDGNVRTNGELLRVTVRLYDPHGAIVWTESFDRELSGLFEMQELIAARIGNSLRVALDVGHESSAYGGTDNPEAYAAYLQAMAHQLDPDQSVPERYLERAIELDAGYVKALAVLSISYGLRSNFAPTGQEAKAEVERMDAATHQAIEANPDLWIGYAARGLYHANARQPDLYDSNMRKVIAFDRGADPDLVGSIASWQLNTGRLAGARASLDRLALIDPQRTQSGINMWQALLEADYDDVIARFHRWIARDEDFAGSDVRWVFWAYLAKGDEAQARSLAAQYNLDTKAWDTYLASPEIRIMSQTELTQWVDRELGHDAFADVVNLATFAGHYGEPELAARLLRMAIEKRPVGGYPLIVMWWPSMAEMRRTEEFKRIARDTGLVAAWRESDDWPDACHPFPNGDFECE